jgi:hypothetical protein
LVRKARDHSFVISKFLENKLQDYFSFIDAVSSYLEKIVRRGGDLTAHFTGKNKNVFMSAKE